MKKKLQIDLSERIVNKLMKLASKKVWTRIQIEETEKEIIFHCLNNLGSYSQWIDISIKK